MVTRPHFCFEPTSIKSNFRIGMQKRTTVAEYADIEVTSVTSTLWFEGSVPEMGQQLPN